MSRAYKNTKVCPSPMTHFPVFLMVMKCPETLQLTGDYSAYRWQLPIQPCRSLSVRNSYDWKYQSLRNTCHKSQKKSIKYPCPCVILMPCNKFKQVPDTVVLNQVGMRNGWGHLVGIAKGLRNSKGHTHVFIYLVVEQVGIVWNWFKGWMPSPMGL